MTAAQPGGTRAGLAAVTGATGFLGPHVLGALAAKGWRLRILARRHPELTHAGAAVEVIPGDLSDPAALGRLVQDADAIVHLAGAVRAPDAAAFIRANTEGTGRLAEAWRRVAPQAHFILMSSMAAREPGLSPYAASKREGEERLRRAAGVAGHPGEETGGGARGGFTILRPAAVYGPGDRETLGIFRAAALPVQPLLNQPSARLCLVHAADVATAAAAVAAAPAEGRTFELSDARREGYSWPEIAAAAADALGRRARPVQVPRPLLAAIARLGDIASARGGGAGMLTSAKLREMRHPDWSSHAASQPDDTIWRPAITLAEGFRATIEWYRSREWL